MMHSVIGHAAAGDPYKIDTLFMFMANMAWNSAMNPLETIRCLTQQDENGDYVIPHVIYSDAYFSETVPYADLILPDTTYLERWDAISILDRPIGVLAWAGRCDPPAGGQARPRCAAVPGRADRARRAAGAAGLRQGGWQRRASRIIPTTS